MDKTLILQKYKKEEDRILVAKLLDKISLVEKQNKVQITFFLSPIELQTLKDILNVIGYKNFSIYGASKNAQRNIIILFPNKLTDIFEINAFNYNTICSCIRILNSSNEKYDHKIYLGGLMKLGVKREKIGDIIVYENGADIVISKDVEKFLLSNLSELKRFKKSSIEVIKLEEIVKKDQEYKECKIIISSLRLDNVVSELSRTSRSKAIEMLKQEKVFLNYRNEDKQTKLVKQGDFITIRGIGKFFLETISNNSKGDKYVVLAQKFV